MTLLTRDEAERVVAEARFQGWVSDDDDRMLTRGRADAIHLDEGSLVELKLPGLLGPEFLVRSTDDWRRLKAKFDELHEIVRDLHRRGWDFDPMPKKTGTFAMAIEVYPPGTHRPYGKRVGGMRTWRQLTRPFDETIDATEGDLPALQEPT